LSKEEREKKGERKRGKKRRDISRSSFHFWKLKPCSTGALYSILRGSALTTYTIWNISCQITHLEVTLWRAIIVGKVGRERRVKSKRERKRERGKKLSSSHFFFPLSFPCFPFPISIKTRFRFRSAAEQQQQLLFFFSLEELTALALLCKRERQQPRALSLSSGTVKKRVRNANIVFTETNSRGGKKREKTSEKKFADGSPLLVGFTWRLRCYFLFVQTVHCLRQSPA